MGWKDEGGRMKDEMDYVHGEDFPREPVRVVEEKEIRRYGEYRTRRLVLEAWDALEGVQVSGFRVSSEQLSATSNQSPVVVEKKEERSAPVAAPKPVEDNPAQPMLSDFGLYKCVQCGKMVMGYEKEKHAAEVHKGSVEFRKIGR